MPLNQGQQDAVDAVLRFLLSDEKEFSLSGPAGTGKTFVMKHIMTEILAEYANICEILSVPKRHYELALTATTNKAAEVLTNSSGFPATTLHSYLKLKVTDNYATGSTDIVKTPNWAKLSHKMVFVDEASMVDSTLHKYIDETLDHTCKIIYLGDQSQLAPVFEDISPVYANPLTVATLTEPMRNSGQPALMYLCSQLRDTVATLNFRPIQAVPGIIDYMTPAAGQAFVDRLFAQETDQARILCYTNEQVNGYNHYIRSLRGYPQHFVPGERVINNTAIEISGTMLRVEQELTIHAIDPTHVVNLEVDYYDPNGLIPAYPVELMTRGGSIIVAKLPVDPVRTRMTMDHFASLKKWPAFFKIKNAFPDLRPRDASTVYKAQGSTYHTAILDLTNIGTCRDPNQTARMLYVGASRATDRLVLLGALPPHYHNCQITPQRTASCPAPSLPPTQDSGHMTPSSETF